MKKIAINNCFGGFSLSHKAVKRLAELQGKECYFFRLKFGEDKYKPLTLQEAEKERMLWTAFSVPNPDEVIPKWEDDKELSNKKYAEIKIETGPENREDPLLIQVIEELGEEANGSYAELKIVEIPDDVEYQIEEYDGNEHIAEKHRTWQ